MVIDPTLPSSSVYPSGADLATNSEPMMAEAPARFSTTTGWPICSASRCASVLPMMSALPPGGNGTTSLIGFAG